MTLGRAELGATAAASVVAVLLATVALAFSRAPHDFSTSSTPFGRSAAALSRWSRMSRAAPHRPAAVSLWAVDAAVIGLALLPLLFFALQFSCRHPSRQFVSGPTIVAQFFLRMVHLSAAMGRAWGA